MKTVIGITALFFALSTFGQENPWENKASKNPWITSEATQNDSVIPAETQNTDTDFSYSIKFDNKGYVETDAKGAYASGFLLCSLFNVFGAIPPLFALAVPSSKEYKAKDRLRKEYNNVTPQQIKDYKRGVLKKRFRQTLKGSGAGIIVNFTAIITIIKISSY